MALARLAIRIGLRKLGEIFRERGGEDAHYREEGHGGGNAEGFGSEKGLQNGLQQSREQSVQQGEFDTPPPANRDALWPDSAWTQERLGMLPSPPLEDLGECLLDAASIERLLH
jgi:hypothetical protein